MLKHDTQSPICFLLIWLDLHRPQLVPTDHFREPHPAAGLALRILMKTSPRHYPTCLSRVARRPRRRPAASAAVSSPEKLEPGDAERPPCSAVDSCDSVSDIWRRKREA